MILTGARILLEMKKKNIIIEPFKESQLNSNSYDLRLDNKLKTYKLHKYEICPTGEKIEFIDAKAPNETIEHIIPEQGLILYPNKLYLGQTVEYTETHNYVPLIEGKSSIGRLGIDIHKTAGFGDLSFKGNWTLEITVTEPVKIYPFMLIAQIYYVKPSGAIKKIYTGKYQGQKQIIESRSYLDF